MFDHNGAWLSDYETIPQNDSFFTWVLTEAGPGARIDTLRSKKGHLTSFTPTNAYTTYFVSVTFQQDTVLHSSAIFYVTSTVANHLDIEAKVPRNADLTRDVPLQSVDFGKKDTTMFAYAILRDRFGNYVGNSQNANWSILIKRL